MVRCLSSFDIPMPIRYRIGVRPLGNGLQQNFDAVIWLDPIEVRSMLAQIAKERSVIRCHSLPNNRNAKPRNRRRARWYRQAQAISVFGGSFAKCIQLMRGPEIR